MSGSHSNLVGDYSVADSNQLFPDRLVVEEGSLLSMTVRKVNRQIFLLSFFLCMTGPSNIRFVILNSNFIESVFQLHGKNLVAAATPFLHNKSVIGPRFFGWDASWTS